MAINQKNSPKTRAFSHALEELVNDYDFDRLIELCKTKEKQEIL
ncbi:MAG: hypothetical protein AB4368_00555 [Xenococcaceae cyanobacterium]